MTETIQVLMLIHLKITHNRHTNTKDAMILLQVIIVQEILRIHWIVKEKILINSSNSKVNTNK